MCFDYWAMGSFLGFLARWCAHGRQRMTRCSPPPDGPSSRDDGPWLCLSWENEQGNIVGAFRVCLRLTHWEAVLAGVDESREAREMQGEPHQVESPSSLELRT